MKTSLSSRLASSPRLRGLRRRLNSSALIPGRVRVLIGGRIYSSADYRVLASPAELTSLDGWRNPRVAQRQLRSWQRRLASAEREVRPDVANLVAAVTSAVATATEQAPIGDTQVATVLEAGCGGAYNRGILEGVLPEWRYVGSDFAFPMLATADAGARGALVQASTEALPFGKDAADVVFDGGSIIHIPRWRDALAELCRVARAALVLHTVTVTRGAPTTLLAKRAYGYPVPEWVLHPDDLRAELARGGFEVVRVWDGIAYDLADVVGISTASQTWLALPAR